MMTNVVMFLRIFFTQNNLWQLDRQGTLIVIHKGPKLHLRTSLLLDNADNIQLFLKFICSTVLEAQLATVLTSLAAPTEYVRERINIVHLLTRVELSDHLIFDRLNASVFRELDGWSTGTGSWPVHKSNNPTIIVERDEIRANNTAEEGHSSFETTNITQQIEQWVAGTGEHVKIILQHYLQLDDLVVSLVVTHCGSKSRGHNF